MDVRRASGGILGGVPQEAFEFLEGDEILAELRGCWWDHGFLGLCVGKVLSPEFRAAVQVQGRQGDSGDGQGGRDRLWGRGAGPHPSSRPKTYPPIAMTSIMYPNSERKSHSRKPRANCPEAVEPTRWRWFRSATGACAYSIAPSTSRGYLRPGAVCTFCAICLLRIRRPAREISSFT